MLASLHTLALLLLGAASLGSAPPQASQPPRLKATPPAAKPPAPEPVPPPTAQGLPAAGPQAPGPNIVIDPKTPLADLLPQAPRVQQKTADPFNVDLARVPEVDFQEPLSRKLTKEAARQAIALELAGIRLLNRKKTDAFLEALISKRADLQGMPFAMGSACRTTGERARLFGLLAAGVRSFIAQAAERDGTVLPSSPPHAERFWQLFQKGMKDAKNDLPKLKALLDGKDEAKANPSEDCGHLGDDVDAACVAALMQILAAESAPMRQGLVKYLSKNPHADATRALARLALFSPEEEVRRPAVEALKGRRPQDYQAILMQGFRYPLPEVAQRAAEAVARLQGKDLVPQLVDLLDEPDPRLPVVREVHEKKVPVVRELVRVNHHRNCMLCHAPATGRVPAAVEKKDLQLIMALVTTAPVPLPTEPLPPPSQGYDPSRGPQDLLVRIDTTYLRQDFSLLQPVSGAAPWPDRQRFDFFVRSRVLTDREAEEYRRQAPADRTGKGNPYRRAVCFALRELTGRDAAPTGQAWRKLLASTAKPGPR